MLCIPVFYHFFNFWQKLVILRITFLTLNFFGRFFNFRFSHWYVLKKYNFDLVEVLSPYFLTQMDYIMYQSKGTIFYDDVSDHFPILLEVANKYVPDAIYNSVKFRQYDLASIDFFCILCLILIGTHLILVVLRKRIVMYFITTFFTYFQLL